MPKWLSRNASHRTIDPRIPAGWGSRQAIHAALNRAEAQGLSADPVRACTMRVTILAGNMLLRARKRFRRSSSYMHHACYNFGGKYVVACAKAIPPMYARRCCGDDCGPEAKRRSPNNNNKRTAPHSRRDPSSLLAQTTTLEEAARSQRATGSRAGLSLEAVWGTAAECTGTLRTAIEY